MNVLKYVDPSGILQEDPFQTEEIEVMRIFSQRTSSEATLVAGFSLIIAVLFSGSAIFSVQKGRIFATSAVATKAEVVEILKEEKPTSSPAAFSSSDVPGTNSAEQRFVPVPVFQYKVDGAVFERRAEPRYFASDVSYSVGDTTIIYYNPENPAEIRDILKSEESTTPTVFAGLAAFAWFLFAAFSIHSFRLMRFEACGRKPPATPMIETKCLFIALEATHERIQSARLIRLVCQWIHPETGVEWLIRSASIHPTEIPTDLKLGAVVTCKIDFDNPALHEVLWALKPPSGKNGTSDALA